MDRGDQVVKSYCCKIKRVWAVLLLCILLLSGCAAPWNQVAKDGANGKGDGQAGNTNNTLGQKNAKEVDEEKAFDFTIGFAGDINFDENWSTMEYYRSQGEDITKCISQDLIDEMKAQDIMWINNEFTYSNRGTPMAGKAYTFRGNPDRVNILKELGVDMVGLANNHVYDYGNDALLDTFATLEGAGIPYVGAGRNIQEATTPVYMELDGKTVAFVAASRAEKNRMTPQATENSAGILRCYDTALFLTEIRQADANADYVIALPHWGTEYSYDLEEVQETTGREYLDAGADIVIGAHTHCLQGMEYYNGKPIVYSLGNFWFNEKTLDTMLLQVHIFGNENESHIEVQVIPAIQANHQTRKVTEEGERERIYSLIESISSGIEIDENGIVKE